MQGSAESPLLDFAQSSREVVASAAVDAIRRSCGARPASVVLAFRLNTGLLSVTAAFVPFVSALAQASASRRYAAVPLPLLKQRRSPSSLRHIACFGGRQHRRISWPVLRGRGVMLDLTFLWILAALVAGLFVVRGFGRPSLADRRRPAGIASGHQESDLKGRRKYP